MFQVSIGPYRVDLTEGRFPPSYEESKRIAGLVEEFDMDAEERALCCVTVSLGAGWPFLVVAQRYAPSDDCFFPGVLVVPETARMFVGAGERILCYDLAAPARLWESSVDAGFWVWSRHGDLVVMAAELELAAWTLDGKKSWTTFVEPPWSYAVADGNVTLDVMGQLSEFPLASGPQLAAAPSDVEPR
jgi:hypothetical protein